MPTPPRGCLFACITEASMFSARRQANGLGEALTIVLLVCLARVVAVLAAKAMHVRCRPVCESDHARQPERFRARA